MDAQDILFKKGFNSGYIIAQYQPDLFDTLEKHVKASNSYIQGFIAGGKELEKGKTIIPLKRDDSKDKEMDRDR